MPSSSKAALTADHGIVEGKLVKFTRDVAPYCKGDVVRLDSEAEKYVAARCRALKIEGSVYNTETEPDPEHTEGGGNPVVGAVQAQDADQVDQPTTVHGGTVTNEQDASGKNKPSDKEIADRSDDPKNPRGGTGSTSEVAGGKPAKS